MIIPFSVQTRLSPATLNVSVNGSLLPMLPFSEYVLPLAWSSDGTRGCSLSIDSWKGACWLIHTTAQILFLLRFPTHNLALNVVVLSSFSMTCFRIFQLNILCLSMQCACEQWVIINVRFWSAYLSLEVKSAIHSIAWAKETKLWIKRELNFNLYVKQRPRLKRKSNGLGRKMNIHFFSPSYMIAVPLVLYLNNKSNWSIKLIIFHWPLYSFKIIFPCRQVKLCVSSHSP